MKKFITLGLIALVSCSLSFNSCKKDNDKDDVKPQTQSPKIGGEDGKIVAVPNALANNDNEYAKKCAGYLNDINEISTYLSRMDVPDNASIVPNKELGTITYTWSYENNAVWLVYTETATKYHWQYDINLNNGGRKKFIEAEEAKDGSEGFMKVYEYITGTAFLNYNWTVETNGTVHFTMTGGTNVDVFRYESVVNADGSGKIDVFIANVKLYHLEWNVNGSGSWIWYYEGGTFTGTWE